MQALVDYGLFLAKTLTLFVLVGGLLILLIRSRHGFHADADRIEVTDLNDKYRNMARTLQRASLSRKEFHQAIKRDRKADKQRDKNKDREKDQETERRRIFVIDFHGDIKATEVASLREILTAISLESRDGDEVLVRLENAGGIVIDHGLAASQLARLRTRAIELTVAVDKVAASGGYLMACVADRIIAAPFAVVGSIGVMAQMPNFHRLLERGGVDFELHTAGEYKRTLTMFGENSDAGREKLREQLEDTHTLFKNFIQEYRPDVDLGQVATGEYWHGTQALELGLVDALVTSDDYLVDARTRADIYLVDYAVHKRPLERLISSVQNAVLGGLFGRWGAPG